MYTRKPVLLFYFKPPPSVDHIQATMKFLRGQGRKQYSNRSDHLAKTSFAPNFCPGRPACCWSRDMRYDEGYLPVRCKPFGGRSRAIPRTWLEGSKAAGKNQMDWREVCFNVRLSSMRILIVTVELFRRKTWVIRNPTVTAVWRNTNHWSCFSSYSSKWWL